MQSSSPVDGAPIAYRNTPASSLLASFAQEEWPVSTERLPFTVRIASTPEDFNRAIALRYQAYARHMPEFAETLRRPEPDDYEADTIILLAESKVDGSVIGTMRIQSNSYRPLSMEHSIALPDAFKGEPMVEVRRLGVAKGGAGSLVKTVLIKACLLYCQKNNIKWAMVAARPPLDKSYEKMLFVDVLPGQTFTPLPKANNVPHRVMAFEIPGYDDRLLRAQHPQYRFFCRTSHPDINVDLPVDSVPSSLERLQKPGAAPVAG